MATLGTNDLTTAISVGVEFRTILYAKEQISSLSLTGEAFEHKSLRTARVYIFGSIAGHQD